MLYCALQNFNLTHMAEIGQAGKTGMTQNSERFNCRYRCADDHVCGLQSC